MFRFPFYPQTRQSPTRPPHYPLPFTYSRDGISHTANYPHNPHPSTCRNAQAYPLLLSSPSTFAVVVPQEDANQSLRCRPTIATKRQNENMKEVERKENVDLAVNWAYGTGRVVQRKSWFARGNKIANLGYECAVRLLGVMKMDSNQCFVSVVDLIRGLGSQGW